MLKNLTTLYGRVRIYLMNTMWIFLDKGILMSSSFLLTIYLARYLGPEKYGIFAYAISITSLFGIAGHFGLAGLLVKKFVKEPEKKLEILGTGFIIKGIGYFIGLILVIAFGFITEPKYTEKFWLLMIIPFSLAFKPFDVIDFWFQSKLNYKYTALSRVFAILITLSASLVLIYSGASLVALSIAHLSQSFLIALFFIYFMLVKSKICPRDFKFSKSKAREFINQGGMIFIGSIFAVIYLKIDQLMISWLDGDKSLGIYSVAAKFSEAWYVIPPAILSSFFPKLIHLKKENIDIFYLRLQQLLDLLFIVSLAIAVLVSFFSESIIIFFFGEPYFESAHILSIHIWAAIFIFMRAVLSKWILIENLFVFSAITQGAGALLNIALNFWLIPKYGGVGAAYATLISYAVSSYIALLFNSKTHRLFSMMTKSIFSPIRYSIQKPTL